MKIRVTQAVRAELLTLCLSAQKSTERRMFVRDNLMNPAVDNLTVMHAKVAASGFDDEVLSTAHRIANLLMRGGSR